ncbi:patatin-domain-containing protein [Rhodotorula sp. JG-1b]|nr:patatin-domain-containing protein [Rhodotorula sp. JG-1b]
MQVFHNALSDEPSNNNSGNDGADQQQPEKIIAASDWAPVKEQRRRRGGGGGSSSKPKKRKDVVREGWAYHISRWPLLGLIFLIIFLEFVAYLIVRQSVNTIEFFAGWRGERGRLRHKLRNAETYEEWKRIALELDALLGLNQWKQSAPNAYYDAPLVRRVLKALREFRSRDDVEGVCAVLHACVRNNFAGVESFRLYSESYYGTKNLVQEYLDEVSSSLEYVRGAPPSALPLEEKADFFRSISKNLGASALCLSGGASFGYYHFGVVRALLDQNLLPRVITGTSAGAIVGAICCTRTDAELRELLKPSLADRITACSEPFTVWAKRAWRTGARFDTVEWARKASFFTMGSMTFKEAYERTGRIFNVSVIPYDTHSPTKLLNYITAPDIVIYTAVIASAAVPWIINPVVLLRKNKDGTLSAAEFQGRHKDGSLRVDIPLHALHLLYNVNFSIVSQVNPHVHLFNYAPRGSPGRPVSHRKGRGWRGGFWLSAAEQYWKIEMLKWFRVIRDLELLPEFGGQNWSAVFLQKFEGSVTIWPKSRLKDWTRLLTDPDRDELARMIRVGQGVTWPKVRFRCYCCSRPRPRSERETDRGLGACPTMETHRSR